MFAICKGLSICCYEEGINNVLRNIFHVGRKIKKSIVGDTAFDLKKLAT